MKKIKSLMILIFLIYITLQTLIHSEEVIESVLTSINIWKNSIFPSLFPFFILSELLINYGLSDYMTKIFSPFMNKLFKISGRTSFIFFMSMLSGFPSSAKYTKALYEKNEINEFEATKILMFSHFSNPLFILGFVSLFLNKNICLLILIIHYTTNIIIGLIFRNYYTSIEKNIIIKRSERKFGVALGEAIKNSIDTLLLILGTITFALIINTIINQLDLNIYFKILINSFLEMSGGINYIGNSILPLNIKAVLITMILSFGGISVHFQVVSILSNTKIKYQPYLIARLLHCAISGILVFILFNYI